MDIIEIQHTSFLKRKLVRSTEGKVMSGVPQGSVWGSSRFYVNDINETMSGITYKIADITIFIKNKNFQNLPKNSVETDNQQSQYLSKHTDF